MMMLFMQSVVLISLPFVAFGYNCPIGEGCSSTEFDLTLKVAPGVTEADFVNGACASESPSNVLKAAIADGFSNGEGVPDYGYTVEIPAFGTLLDDGSRRNLRAAERKLQTIPFVYCAVPGYYPCCVEPVGQTCTGRRDLLSFAPSWTFYSPASAVGITVKMAVTAAMSDCLGGPVAVDFSVTERLESTAASTSFATSASYFSI
eukprot:CAMPEP_0116844700 /NCGR_PEP_ID=MMETSP0418-20121206/12844_1 /TAXON_ID=1158023 /ORGANISM="Astrosyne radiata, Strain 13vi08-1A" /LENGTH=203 /DNA_ID=CAMNT_0004475703 /DNA_START=102 /DNA_END=713 /DNA_ORIENTATION=+